MGVTDEVSQDARRVPVMNEVCVMCAKGSASIAAQLVRTDQDMSCPGDFLRDNFFWNSRTVRWKETMSVISISSLEGIEGRFPAGLVV
ncbi:hypothetical protein JTB14_011392 [Gonioctena quinquepunctata]|nr:hypothetical protein JTB14_011392 [Gonioctena quinquepunctata]